MLHNNVTYIYIYVLHILLGDCGQLPSKRGAYTILNDANNTTVNSIIHFECIQAHPITDLNKIHHQARCNESGLWHPHPQTMCGHIMAPMVSTGTSKQIIGSDSIILLL